MWLGDHHLGHLICTTCNRLRSIDADPDEPRPDICECNYPPDPEPPSRERLIPCQVCGACGLDIASGHTRWRQNFCETCLPDFGALRSMLGWWQIPRGIHTIVNQVDTISGADLVAAKESEDGRVLLERKLVGFGSDLRQMGTTIDALRTHTANLVGRRLQATGLVSNDTVPWADYIAACRQIGITADDGWTELLRSYDLEDWIDDVQAWRRARRETGQR